MDSEFGTDIHDGVENSTDIELRLGDDGAIVRSSVEGLSQLGQNEKNLHGSSGAELTINEGDEPYVGQEFESEASAHAFYSEYGMQMGFITRVSNLSRSRRDGTIIARTIVCNKEGYRVADKRDRKNIRPRAPTRVGCKAMISIKKLDSGKWAITKFVKEHTHALTPGKGRKGSIYNQFPNEHMRIQELTQQLLVERKRSASFRRIIDLLFNHIEEHTQNLSERIQYIVDSVKEIESEGKDHQKPR
ncbi:hypothetical protein L1049_020739 [Liquidambar formosana]|uniref:FAR1 domain-containing protein n=1 Tax=Liquidambar formosana TaxID=63359 RepID=A0AAP0S6Y5_LIQFO